LAAIHDDEVWAERENALEIRVQQRPDPRQLRHFWWELVEAANPDDAVAGTECEQHFGHRRDD
jgi:hypothetical protein